MRGKFSGHLTIRREISFRVTKLLTQLHQLHIVGNLSRLVISFYELGVGNQGGDIDRVAKGRNVKRHPQKYEMEHERGADEL